MFSGHPIKVKETMLDVTYIYFMSSRFVCKRHNLRNTGLNVVTLSLSEADKDLSSHLAFISFTSSFIALCRISPFLAIEKVKE